jgi:hypothetical protein
VTSALPVAHLHLVVATLRADAPAPLVATAVDHARALAQTPGAVAVRIAHGGDQLIVATWLAATVPLEAFAASREHMAFIMQGLAPVIRSMWSLAVATATAPPPTAGGELWAVALPADVPLFEPQVRELLDQLATLGGITAAGPTAEERERYRAGAAIWVPAAAESAFADALAALAAAWAGRGAALVLAHAPQQP